VKCSTCGDKDTVIGEKVERSEKCSVHPVGQERKYHSGIGMESWNDQCLGPRRGGLESLIWREWQELSIRRQCRKRK